MADNKRPKRRLVAFRLPQQDLDLLDRLVVEMNRARSHVLEYSRTDVLRLAIHHYAEHVVFVAKDAKSGETDGRAADHPPG